MARRLAAIMFTDIVGFTALAQRDEKAALQLLQEQGDLVHPLLEAHRGRLVNTTGDGLLIEFPNAVDAIECGVDLQSHVHERNARPGPEPLRLRMAIHLGDIQDVGTDIFGDAVNIAAHIRALADPGGVCLSEPVYVQVRNKVLYPLEKLGTRTLKDVQGPMDLYRVVLPWEHDEVPTRPLLSRRLAAIMITDVVGFTASAQANEADALARLREQEGIVRPLFEPFKGREIKSTGDGFLVEFESVLGALECAVEIQRRMRERNSRKTPPPLELRIGIHAGDVEESGGDIFGDAVNIASRVEPLAEPGGVCLSEPVYVQVRSKVPYHLEKLGAKTLKGVREPMEVYRVVLPWATDGTRAEGPSPPRIAVLPLQNISPDPQDEYFADGMTEEIIATISKVRELSVISRTSVMQYRNQTRNVAEIGRELNTRVILEGSVRKVGSRARIAVQLIDAVADRHLWAQSYDRSLEDVFSVQSEIAQEVAAALQVRLLEDDKERIARIPTSITEAHLLYLKGRYHSEHLTKEELKAGIGYYEQAVQKDPSYALAFSALSVAYHSSGFFEYTPAQEAITKAEGAARRALELDPSLAEAHLALADARFLSWDFRGFADEVRRALDLNPNLSQAHIFAAYAYEYANPPQWEEALREMQEALKLDPLSTDVNTSVATSYLYAGRHEKAVELLETALKADPANSHALCNLGLAHVRQGRFDAGIGEIKKSMESSREVNPARFSDLVYALARAGRMDEAREVMSELVRYHEDTGRGTVAVAYAHASLGDREEAFEWLERAHKEHSPNLATAVADFALDELRSDSRFPGFLEKMGFPTNPTMKAAYRPRRDAPSPSSEMP